MRPAVLLCVLLAACASDPVSLIPAADRRAAEAPSDGPITVEEMLARARTAPSASPTVPGRLLVRFDGEAVQPDAAQRGQLHDFAAAAQTARQALLVTSRPGSFEDSGAPVLGQRRAVAVARELSAVVDNVNVKFDPAIPPGVVVVTQVTRP
jgi:hypothetical protein